MKQISWIIKNSPWILIAALSTAHAFYVQPEEKPGIHFVGAVYGLYTSGDGVIRLVVDGKKCEEWSIKRSLWRKNVFILKCK